MERIYKINRELNKRFPEGNDPFKIITRLLEEGGELAAHVNHIEKQGVKLEKLGIPKPELMAKEIQDVIRCALQLATYYNLEDALEDSITQSISKIQRVGDNNQ